MRLLLISPLSMGVFAPYSPARAGQPMLLTQTGVNFIQHRRARAEIFLAELVERGLVGVEVGVEVFGVGREVEKTGEDLALGGGLGDVVDRVDLVGGVVVGGGLAELDDAPVLLR